MTRLKLARRSTAMYVPAAFAADDPAELARLIRQNAFATVISTGADGLIASHVPLLYRPDQGRHGTLVGHLAGPNPQVEAIRAGASMLAIFSGPHAYVSPGWYQTAPAVPTWNYVAVHASGHARALDDAAAAAVVAELAAVYEAGRDPPWRFADQPPAFLAGMLRGIVAFEIPIDRLEGKAKLSQNRGQADRAGVVQGLRAENDPGAQALADLMAASVL
ncbi:MAG TPA: FMN-binding negative transcriptional regulator [Stellaceae bacterium]|nr:FMN-binding negative transcriptional regulator [Stellaceae bacterium]